MPGLTRILGGLGLMALVVVIAVQPVDAAQKKKKTDPTKKPIKKKYGGNKSGVQGPNLTGSLPAGTKFTAEQLARHIDKMLDVQIKAEKVDVSARADDAEFFRRVYLDITGKIPPADKALAFLESKDAKKRSKLVDDLLASKDYGKNFADIWTSLLLPKNSDNLRLRQYYANLTTWMEEKFNDNTGWDKIAKEIVTATGPTDKKGPAVFWVANLTADKATDNISKNFLGVQLQCAQCHNHPFTDWKQEEYWGMAAFFMRTGPNGNPKGAAKKGNTITIGEKMVKANRKRLPEGAKILPPKFLLGEKPTVSKTGAIRPVLADWMISKKNAFFARAAVNRMWGHFFGRGFTAPVDDMHDENPVSHNALLNDLAKQFQEQNYDLKFLIRAITSSKAYQRTSKPKGNNFDAAPELFARMAIKVLTPEQLWDSLTSLMGPQQGGKNKAARAKAKAKGRAGNPRQAFVAFFGIDENTDPTEYQVGIPQVLRLMNAPQFNNAGMLGNLIKNAKTPGEAVEKLYLATLARKPRTEELDRIKTYLDKNKENTKQAMAGVLWALLNSSEFALNH